MSFIRRYDQTGRDITDLSGLWSEDDVLVVRTNLNHPDDIPGSVHTNGPAAVWIKKDGTDWINTGLHSLAEVHYHLLKFGYSWFLQNKGGM